MENKSEKSEGKRADSENKRRISDSFDKKSHESKRKISHDANDLKSELVKKKSDSQFSSSFNSPSLSHSDSKDKIKREGDEVAKEVEGKSDHSFQEKEPVFNNKQQHLNEDIPPVLSESSRPKENQSQDEKERGLAHENEDKSNNIEKDKNEEKTKLEEFSEGEYEDLMQESAIFDQDQSSIHDKEEQSRPPLATYQESFQEQQHNNHPHQLREV